MNSDLFKKIKSTALHVSNRALFVLLSRKDRYNSKLIETLVKEVNYETDQSSNYFRTYYDYVPMPTAPNYDGDCCIL